MAGLGCQWPPIHSLSLFLYPPSFIFLSAPSTTSTLSLSLSLSLSSLFYPPPSFIFLSAPSTTSTLSLSLFLSFSPFSIFLSAPSTVLYRPLSLSLSFPPPRVFHLQTPRIPGVLEHSWNLALSPGNSWSFLLSVLIVSTPSQSFCIMNVMCSEQAFRHCYGCVKKTECMVISKKAIVPSCNLQSRGQQIKLVKKFKYLGYTITSDGKCITEIKKRIATAKDAFQKLSLILKNRNISMTTKFRVLKTYVWSTLAYGCECWTITSDIEKKIEAAEMWFIRRMLRISWAEKKTNVNVLREGNVQRSLLKTIRKRQMEFLGHVCRRRGLEFLSLTGKVEGKRDRGKQRITFLYSLCNSATGGQSKGLNFLKLSDDRDVWRGMVANVCSRSGT